MKWLLVLASLFIHTQVSAAGLCIKDDNGEMPQRCIVGWNGVTNQIAYAGALSAMIDKFTTIIAYDSYINHGYWFGFECLVDSGVPATDEDPAEPPGGCTGAARYYTETINVPLATAFQRTLTAGRALIMKLQFGPALYYRNYTTNVPEKIDKSDACRSVTTYLGIAPLWRNFADSFQRDYDSYKDKYRKKIFKHYFQATKRLYGFYANRMKKLMRQVKREYNCNF